MAGGKNIGKLSIGVDLDASKAQSGLTDLVQKIELFQASVSNFGSLALNLAGFASIGAIMGKVAYDAARFADQIERAKKNSDIAISIRQGNIDWDKQWNEAGPVGIGALDRQSVHVGAAVDVQRVAGDEPGLWVSEEPDRDSDLFGFAPSSQRGS